MCTGFSHTVEFSRSVSTLSQRCGTTVPHALRSPGGGLDHHRDLGCPPASRCDVILPQLPARSPIALRCPAPGGPRAFSKHRPWSPACGSLGRCTVVRPLTAAQLRPADSAYVLTEPAYRPIGSTGASHSAGSAPIARRPVAGTVGSRCRRPPAFPPRPVGDPKAPTLGAGHLHAGRDLRRDFGSRLWRPTPKRRAAGIRSSLTSRHGYAFPPRGIPCRVRQ